MTVKEMSLLLQRAWLGGDRLATDVHVVISNGRISALTTDARDASGRRIPGVALPGLVNTHSHAFHRLLRGQTHERGGDFWVWRDRMYEAAASLTPESYEALATAVFVEMAMAGITTVGEFHYLHHQPGGSPYEEPNEMAHALVRAARRAGIRICLLDACYLAGGLSGEQLDPVQQRFSDGSAESWIQRAHALGENFAHANDVRVGLAPHSVRAVPVTELRRLAADLRIGSPIHIHVSEQPAENEACLAAHGVTPTGLLAEVGLLGENTTAIHATHLTERDIGLLAGSGTGVCYCATTERDLADGIGPSGDFREQGVEISVGTDSHASIDLFEETRGVEMHERLRSGKRGRFSPSELGRIATLNGRRALGFDGGAIEVGAVADMTIVSLDTPRTAGTGHELGGILFSATAADVTDVMVDGKWIVEGGHHPQWDSLRPLLG